MNDKNRNASPHENILQRVEHYVWGDGGPRPALHERAADALRLAWAVGRDIADGQITLRAMSLVYTTLLSLVPLLAISFSILKGFGVHNQIEPFLLNAMEPLGERKEEIVGRIVGFVDNMQVGVLGSVGFVLLFYTVISLMQKIELAFNEVWQISSRRTFAERFKDYLSVIVVGPVLIFASLGISATVMSDPLMERIANIQGVSMLVALAGRLVPIVMVSLAFTSIYLFVPNTRVRMLPALTGGFVAGVMWNVVGWLFAGFVAQANRYEAIYSGFATPILFMIWLYVGWLILLIGATIAFYRQHPEYLSGRQLTGTLSHADKERLALQAVRVIGERFYAGSPAPSAEALASELRVPSNAVELILAPLEHRGLVASTDGVPPAFLPSCPWESASVEDVLQAIRLASRDGRPHYSSTGSGGAEEAILDRRQRLCAETFASVSLKSLAGADTDGAAERGRACPSQGERTTARPQSDSS